MHVIKHGQAWHVDLGQSGTWREVLRGIGSGKGDRDTELWEEPEAVTSAVASSAQCQPWQLQGLCPAIVAVGPVGPEDTTKLHEQMLSWFLQNGKGGKNFTSSCWFAALPHAIGCAITRRICQLVPWLANPIMSVQCLTSFATSYFYGQKYCCTSDSEEG